jgi:uncharacterized protein (DUF488 family)
MIYFAMAPDFKKVFTLGTDRRSEEDFVEILLSYGIDIIVDVRRFPTSKMTAFTQAHLIKLLKMEGLRYSFLGAELGGFRKGGYGAFAQTDEFRGGIDSIEEILLKNTGAILCAERFPWKCHRRWIARELGRRGWQVIHIIDKGKVWIPKTGGRAAELMD